MTKLPFGNKNIIIIFSVLSLTGCGNASHKQISSNRYKITVTALEPADDNKKAEHKRRLLELFNKEARSACGTYQFWNNSAHFTSYNRKLTLEGAVTCIYND